MKVPFPRSYWVQEGQLLAGCYPGDNDPAIARKKIIGLSKVGVNLIINLMQADETCRGVPFVPYQEFARKCGMICRRYPIRDNDIPTKGEMIAILCEIRLWVASGRVVYVHCWGGHGRTGTVVGCWLAENGHRGQSALDRIECLRRNEPTRLSESPSTIQQRQFVVAWPEWPQQADPDRRTHLSL